MVEFIGKKKKKIPNLESEIIRKSQDLDEIWILSVENNFDIHLMHRIKPGA